MNLDSILFENWLGRRRESTSRPEASGILWRDTGHVFFRVDSIAEACDSLFVAQNGDWYSDLTSLEPDIYL